MWSMARYNKAMYTTLALRVHLFALLGVLIAFMLPLAAHAQQPTVTALAEESVFVAPPGTVSCFDYYSFGSIKAELAASVETAVSGTPIVFTGTLENMNDYPIVDGALYAKIFRIRPGGRDANGHDLVDQFIVRGDITIPARGKIPVSVSWQIPSMARSGEYQLATFFATSRKFNLMGLSFTDDVVGGTARFDVSGEQTNGVQFEKTGVTVAGEKYQFATFPPHVSASAPIEIAATIRNTTAQPQRASVSWAVYQWDAQLRENAVQEETAEVEVPAKGSAPVRIIVSDAQYPVYLAVGTLTWKDTKSIVGVRFVREDIDRVRINFPGVTAYPLVAGQENTLFSCLHNSGSAHVVPGGRLELTLSAMDGSIIFEHVYEGDVSGTMMGIAQPFIPKKDYDRFVLDARLYQDNQFVDEAHLVYDCDSLRPEGPCSARNASGLGAGAPSLMVFLAQHPASPYVLGVLALLVALAAMLLLRRRRGVNQNFPRI